jgi:hypothetical protein
MIGPLLVKLNLNGLKQCPIENSGLLAREDLALVADLANIEAVAQEGGERSPGEWDASDCSSIGQRTEFGLDAGLPQVSEKKIQAAEVEVAAIDVTDRCGLVRNDRNLSILGLVTQGNHTADPKALAFGGSDLVADALGGDLALELGEGQQNIEREPSHRGRGVELLRDRNEGRPSFSYVLPKAGLILMRTILSEYD